MNNLALLFPGQGSQYSGMGIDLYKNHIEASRIFDEASDVLGFDIKKICFENDKEYFKDTQNVQLAVFVLSMAMFKVYMKEYGIKPTISAGHSLGEYSALTCADAISFRDALKLINKRGAYMKQACENINGGMIAVKGVDKAIVEEICSSISRVDSYICPSNYNSPMQTTISGHIGGLEKALELLNSKGINAVKLNVSIPTHCKLLESAKNNMLEEFKGITINKPKWEIVSNVTGKPYSSTDEIRKLLPEQIIHPVLWTTVMDTLKQNNVTIALELGPKAILRNICNDSWSQIRGLSFDNPDDRKRLEKYLYNKIYQSNRQNFINLCMGVAVSVKNMNLNQAEYNEGVIKPYKELEKMQYELDKSEKSLTENQMDAALKYLTQILETKMLPKDKIEQRINALVQNIS